MADSKLYGTGYIPDVPALEDLSYSSVGEILDEVDLRPKFKNEVEQQEMTSSCSANAVVANTEFVIAVKYGNTPRFSYPELSRRFIYYEGRAVDGLQTVDRGSVIRSVVTRATQVGICEEALFPFFTTPSAMLERPPAECYTEAAKHKILRVERIQSLDDALNCLSRGYPFVFGFQTYTLSMQIAGQTAKMPMPSGTRNGGHAVCIVGFKRSTREFIMRNSWGTSWGDRGYCTMPFDYVINPNLASDHWTIADVAWTTDIAA